MELTAMEFFLTVDWSGSRLPGVEGSVNCHGGYRRTRTNGCRFPLAVRWLSGRTSGPALFQGIYRRSRSWLIAGCGPFSHERKLRQRELPRIRLDKLDIVEFDDSVGTRPAGRFDDGVLLDMQSVFRGVVGL